MMLHVSAETIEGQIGWLDAKLAIEVSQGLERCGRVLTLRAPTPVSSPVAESRRQHDPCHDGRAGAAVPPCAAKA
jgi:hypothetical protein